ncbi:S41 family peptidase [Streptomyces bohaiensis]|uniref:S41 family peptidase n=1 Tax=Streptomyces bohaiensis TaxID=1431344 RepID=UPI003B761D9E
MERVITDTSGDGRGTAAASPAARDAEPQEGREGREGHRDLGDPGYLRFPHLHGDRVCFVSEDDLWLAPLPGADGRPAGRAWRLTADRTRVARPRFSPDGRRIAFTAWSSLDPEIHVLEVAGGPARPLTHWAADDTRVCGWAGDDILAVSSHGQPFAHHSWAYRLHTDGSPGEQLPWGPVSDIAVHGEGPDRRTLLLTGRAPHEAAFWKRYRGGGTGRLWLHGQRLLPELTGQVECPMFVGDRIAFLSDHEGVGNLYSCRPDGSDLRRHTDHDTRYARHAATDGSRVVYQSGGELWLVTELTAASRPRRLAVDPGGPRNGRRGRRVPTAAHLQGLAVDATGRASAITVGGSLYWLTHRDGPGRVIAGRPGVRIRLPEMLGDSGRIAYVTDAAGEDAIEVAYLPRASGGCDPLRLATGRLGRVRELVASPDGRTLAVASHDGGLLLVPVPEETAPAPMARDGAADGQGGTAGAVELTRSTNGAVRDLAFSPDSAWLAWSHPGLGRSLRQIRLARVTAPAPPATEDTRDVGNTGGDEAAVDGGPAAGSSAEAADQAADEAGAERRRSGGRTGPGQPRHLILDVTDGRFEDEEPVFTRDGRYLAFLSWRGFDPVYDVHTGDLSFPLGCRPYLVPLSSATPSPFALTPEGRPAAGGLDPADSGGEEGATLVEAEGLASRVTPFPVPASKYSALRPVAGGGLVWLRWPISGALGETFANPADTSGQPTLVHFDIATCAAADLTGDVDWFAVSGDGSRLVVAEDGELRAVPATDEADPESTVFVDLRRIVHHSDPPAEWRNAFEEAGRLVRDLFWDPGMCGIDWPAVLDTYRPLLARVSTPDEFADLLRETLGELGTSHAYVSPSRANEGPPTYRRAQGLLGADFVRDRDAPGCTPGGWRLARVLPGDSSDSRARSPLAGTGIRVGALLTEVNGHPVDPVTGPWPLLAGNGGSTVELTFLDPGPGRPGPAGAAAPDPPTAPSGSSSAGRPGAATAAPTPAAAGGDPLGGARVPLGPGAPTAPPDTAPAGAGPPTTTAGGTGPPDTGPADTGPAAEGTTGVQGGASPGSVGNAAFPEHGAGAAAAPGAAGPDGSAGPDGPEGSGAAGLRGAGVPLPPRARRIAVVPLLDERPLRYQHWVARRRAVVRELSGGRCGYVHIPDMGGSGWAQLNRDLRLEFAREALIVDVRGNAGGHISELVVEKLSRRILGWDVTRDAEPVSYASNAPRGPVVALADEATSSDGDMITAAFQLLRLGPVVGCRTWGGVVGMTGRHRLGDGTVITVPRNAAWLDGHGWDVENHGVEPDLEAVRTPLDWAEGRYVVLDAAVRTALHLLAHRPAAAPPRHAGAPDRRRPPLPPRPGRAD